MKRTALNHTKTKRLMRLLDVPQYVAVGILESLWHLTAREAPAGNIGKLTDEDIAISLDWRGPGAVLETALVDSGWLERHPQHRLIVHDWHEHSDDSVDNQVARSLQRYANGSMPRMNRLSKPERELLRAQYAHGVRTEDHKLPLPEPKPLPEPEPVPVPPAAPDVPIVFNHDMVATEVMSRTRAGGMKLRMLIADIALNAIANGQRGEDVIEHLCGQWDAYNAASARLEWQYGSLEKFLAGGRWHDSALWPWKQGTGPPKPAAVKVDALEAVRAQRAKAQEERDRAGNSQ